MSVDFKKFNEAFGGEEAVKAVKEAEENGGGGYTELPDGTYVTKLDKLELGATKVGKPLIKGQFRIVEGKHTKQCLFFNQVFCRADNGSGFPIFKGLEFLRSLSIFEDTDVDFDGDYEHFDNLLLDMAEEAQRLDLKFEIKKSTDGEYTRIDCIDVFE